MSTTVTVKINELPQIPEYKDPDDDFSVLLDVSALVTDLGSNLDTVAYTTDSGLTVSTQFPPSNTTTTATVTLEGGEVGTNYKVSALFTFVNGKQKRRSFYVGVAYR